MDQFTLVSDHIRSKFTEWNYFPTVAKRGEGGYADAYFCPREGGRESENDKIFAYVIYERPLSHHVHPLTLQNIFILLMVIEGVIDGLT